MCINKQLIFLFARRINVLLESIFQTQNKKKIEILLINLIETKRIF